MADQKILTSEAAVREALAGLFEWPAFVILPGVSNGTGNNRTRTIDALVMGVWQSRGTRLAGVEIKVHRGDFRRELKDPAKAEAFFPFLDQFWLAVGDESIVRDGELPDDWGLLVPNRTGTAMKVAKAAPVHKGKPPTRTFLAAILRRAGEHIRSDELRKAIRAEVEAEHDGELERLREVERTFERTRSAQKHAELIARFAERSGVYLDTWNIDALDRAADVVKAIGLGSYTSVIKHLRHEMEGAKRLAARVNEDADEVLAELSKLEAAAVIHDEPDQPPEPAAPIGGP